MGEVSCVRDTDSLKVIEPHDLDTLLICEAATR